MTLQDAAKVLSALRPTIIAIDGPAASGKSTVGYHLAQLADFLFFDTARWPSR
jgi:cytidylate kinase